MLTRFLARCVASCYANNFQILKDNHMLIGLLCVHRMTKYTGKISF